MYSSSEWNLVFLEGITASIPYVYTDFEILNRKPFSSC